mmetsp:Transcript_23553/g.31586  ORF Transcript_23553/g.31586 Transcript_23553/m.31586 type:complete len:115 (+) Transcript_23553:29-373(+)
MSAPDTEASPENASLLAPQDVTPEVSEGSGFFWIFGDCCGRVCGPGPSSSLAAPEDRPPAVDTGVTAAADASAVDAASPAADASTAAAPPTVDTDARGRKRAPPSPRVAARSLS